MKRFKGWLVGLCLIGGLLLTIIGIRFLLVPDSAADTFGVVVRPGGHELHYVIGLRDIWLGLLATAFALLRLWRALVLWFAMCSVVCFADAAIVSASTGQLPQIAFHVVSGILSIGLAAAIWRFTNDEPRP